MKASTFVLSVSLIVMSGGLGRVDLLAQSASGTRQQTTDAGDPQKDAQAVKQLVKEGDTLLKAHKLPEARAKYLAASRLVNDPSIEGKQAVVEQEIDKGVEKILRDCDKLYRAHKYDEAIKKLDEAEALRKNDPTVSYNRALIKFQSGDKAGAIESLDRAADAVSNAQERTRLRTLKSEWETGEKPAATLSAERSDALKELNASILSGTDPEETCQKLRAVSGSTTQSATLLFNLAKCAEDEGHLEEASALLDKYFALAPQAQDDKAVNDDLQSILEVQRRAGPEAMKLYADADRDARAGRHKQAINALEQAEALAPNLPDTQLRLARLLQGIGDVVGARQRYERYLALETDGQQRTRVEEEKNALDERAKEYQELVRPAAERLRVLLARSVSYGRPMGYSAARDELKSVTEDLQRASLMMPLGLEVNEMLAQVYLQGGSYGAARKAFSAVQDAGSPVWFYGEVEDVPGWSGVVHSKIEIDSNGIRVVGLAQYDKKKKAIVPFKGASNADGLGGFLAPYAAGDTKQNVFSVAADAVTIVETENNAVRVTWLRKDKAGAAVEQRLVIRPYEITVPLVPQGPVARQLANPYTRLFRDFGDRKIKLGAEHMTGGEKFGMAMSVAAAAGGGFAAVGAIGNNAQLLSAVLHSVTSATIALQSSLDAQARMLRQTDFKIIPVEDPKPEFRADLLH